MFRADLTSSIEEMNLKNKKEELVAYYNVLDVSEFKHFRINHSEKFAEEKNHINGIENFWNQAKRHLRKFNGIPKENFYLFIKECQWRFNVLCIFIVSVVITMLLNRKTP